MIDKNRWDLFISTWIIFIIVILSSCESDIYVPVSTSQIEDVRNITIQQVDYDSIIVSNNENLILQTKDIDHVILGEKENLIFVGQDTIKPVYIGTNGNYTLQFKFQKKVESSIVKYDFTLRYLLFDYSWVDLDTFVLMYRYPYESTTIFITADLIQYPDIFFQDFDMNKEYLFFHPTGPLGLYQYSFNSKQTRNLVKYGSGDFITSDSTYVFYQNGDYVYRYNLMRDSTDLQLKPKQPFGMDIYNHTLYVLLRDIYTPYTLARFDLDGNLIDSRPYQKLTSYMTIHDDILYSVDYSEKAISRFDLTTNTFLESRSAPTSKIYGIRIYGDRFYYADWGKRMIGTLPLWEIE